MQRAIRTITARFVNSPEAATRATRSTRGLSPQVIDSSLPMPILSDPELFALLRDRLFAAVVGDILDR